MENECYAVQRTPNRKGRGWKFQEFLSFSLRYIIYLKYVILLFIRYSFI